MVGETGGRVDGRIFRLPGLVGILGICLFLVTRRFRLGFAASGDKEGCNQES